MRSIQVIQHSLDNQMTDDPVKCVWMLAGVVSYKLCDRHYDCESCLFDQAMRSAPSQLTSTNRQLMTAGVERR
jgi:hypothetical protein